MMDSTASSLMNSLQDVGGIKADKVSDHEALSQSLLAHEQGQAEGGPGLIHEQVVFVDETGDNGGGHHGQVTVHTTGERQPNHWRDAWAAVLFLGHQVAIFYLAFGWGIPALNYGYSSEADGAGDGGADDTPDGNDSGDDPNRWLADDDDTYVHLGGFVLLCFLSSIGALLLGAAAIAVMIRFAEKTIQFSLFFAVACNILVVVSFMWEEHWLGAGVSGLLLLLVVAYTRAVWSRVPFAASNLLSALTAVQTNGGLIWVSLGLTVAVSLWTLLWILALLGVYMKTAECHDGVCDTHTNGFFFFLLFVSYYWTSEVSKNVMHVTTAGTVGTWWFAPDDACTYCSPAITDSLRRATTYSLGSICLGSLLTAILQLLHQWCHELRRRGATQNAVLLCVVEFLLRILERLVSYFNKWAYIYVGLYGYDYVTSGTKVVTLFRERGWTTIINDHLVTRALALVSLVIGALTGCLGLALASATNWMSDFGTGSVTVAFLPFVVPFICGWALSTVLLSVVASAVDTVIVSFAEAPLEFERNHPGLYTQMVAAWRLAFPDEFRQ